MVIDATKLEFIELNRKIKSSDSNVTINNCYGHRFIGTGLDKSSSCKKITINGVPGNALGAYLDGTDIEVFGNVQDAVGDTMNDGSIVVNGNAGDALGYAMRGGKILVKANAGYRTGIHMKQYKDKKPVIIVGGNVGSFLGEYLAGGLIIVLGLFNEEKTKAPVGNFVGNGMHGGVIYIRSNVPPQNLPVQVNCEKVSNIIEIENELKEYADTFNMPIDLIKSSDFYKLTPNAKSPYKQLYTIN